MIVMKFGGESLSNLKKIKNAAEIIAEKKFPIIVVVSAMGKMTDKLISLSKKACKNPKKREQDMLLTIGERLSMSLLTLSLMEKNIKAISLTGSQAGIITTCDHGNAKIVDVKAQRILKYLENHDVIIVSGFQGVSYAREITTLGRGGSDITSVALAIALEAKKVEFYKDVEGIFFKDPKLYNTKKHDFLNYKKALEIVGENGVLHRRSIELAEKNKILLHVLSYKIPGIGTIIN